MRIAPNDHMTYTHPKANRWLTDFLIDLKTMCRKQSEGEQYQPFTTERLNEWHTHREDVESCVDWESSFVKHQADLHDMLIHEHASAVMHFNGLVIDLKLMIAGFEYEAITPERIVEADKYYFEITRCRKHRAIHYL